MLTVWPTTPAGEAVRLPRGDEPVTDEHLATAEEADRLARQRLHASGPEDHSVAMWERQRTADILARLRERRAEQDAREEARRAAEEAEAGYIAEAEERLTARQQAYADAAERAEAALRDLDAAARTLNAEVTETSRYLAGRGLAGAGFPAFARVRLVGGEFGTVAVRQIIAGIVDRAVPAAPLPRVRRAELDGLMSVYFDTRTHNYRVKHPDGTTQDQREYEIERARERAERTSGARIVV